MSNKGSCLECAAHATSTGYCGRKGWKTVSVSGTDLAVREMRRLLRLRNHALHRREKQMREE